MEAADLKFSLIDSYLRLLQNLSPDSKLELISKLSESLKSPKKESDKSTSELFGAFITTKSAEDIINELKAGRKYTRTSPELE